MNHVPLRNLLCLAGLSLFPGCLPAILQQEIRPEQVAIRVTTVEPVREGPPAPPLPQATLQVGTPSQPQEQEVISPRALVAKRLAMSEPPPAESPAAPVPVPVDQLPLPEPPSDPALVSAVRAYLGGNLDLTRKHLGESRSAPTRATQEELLGLLARLHEKDLDQMPNEEAGQLLDRVERLARAVQAQTPLLLQNLCFCRRLKSFGIYDPLPAEPGFHSGINGAPGERVCVYAEVRNVAPRKDGCWHVLELDGTLEILSSSGEIVFRTDFPATPDRSRSPRTDCFVGYEFNVPHSIPSGRYQLRVHVRDLTSRQQRRISQTLDFRIVDPVTVAGR